MPLRWLRRPWRRPPTAAAIGRRGERVAVRALKRAGYRVLARNVVTPCGEVDVLAVEPGHLVVVEVKTTARAGGPPPGCRLHGRQAARLLAAGRWLHARTRPRPPALRLDLVSVTLGPGRPAVRIHRDRLGPPGAPDEG